MENLTEAEIFLDEDNPNDMGLNLFLQRILKSFETVQQQYD